MTKSENAFRTISEVATELDVPAHVLRFWETKFPQIKPMKRGGGRRYYRPEDMTLLRGVREMLHIDGYSIKGVQKVLKEQGVKVVSERADGTIVSPAPAPVVPAEAKIVPVALPNVPETTGEVDLTAADRASLEKALKALETLRAELMKNGRAAA